MNDAMEDRLREHLHSIDGTPVRDARTVSDTAQQIGRRRRRQRRAVATLGSVMLVVLASLAVWINRDRTRSVAPAATDVAPATTAVVTTAVPTTVAVPPTTAEVVPPPTTAADDEPSTTTVGVKPFAPIAPDPRGAATFPSAVWSGTEVLVIGGHDPQGSARIGASAFDPATGTWRTLADPPGESPRVNAVVAWTGSEMLVIGGGEYDGGDVSDDGLAYDPATDTWRSLGTLPGVVTDRSPAVWTGSQLLVWPLDQADDAVATPAALDVTTGSWHQLPAPPIEPRREAASVWTGEEWIIWGGTARGTDLGDGAAYAPATNTWRTIAASPLSPRRVGAVWTGEEMLISAGASGGDAQTGNFALALSDGAAYDPVADSWHSISDGSAHPGFLAVWTGDRMVMFAKGGAAIYDAGTDQWIDMCCGVDQGGVVGGTPVWTGSVVLTIGSGDPTVGGAIFTPPTR